MDPLLQEAIKNQTFPGVVALISHKDKILYQKAFGNYEYPTDPNQNPMELHTLFDLASLTKVLSTTPCAQLLYQWGFMKLEDPVMKFMPLFNNNGKDKVLILNLLLHNAGTCLCIYIYIYIGFPPDPEPNYWEKAFKCPEYIKSTPPQLSFSCYGKIHDSGSHYIYTVYILCIYCVYTIYIYIYIVMNQILVRPVGSKYVYSDLSMITMHFVIGTIVKEKNLVEPKDLLPNCPSTELGGETCYYEAFARTKVFKTAEMPETGFLPKNHSACAPTYNSSVCEEILQGKVMDGNAYASGGIMGHAGLFSNVVDIHSMLYKLMYPTVGEFIDRETVKLFTTVYNASFSHRALGWETNYPGSGNYHECGTLSQTSNIYIYTVYI